MEFAPSRRRPLAPAGARRPARELERARLPLHLRPARRGLAPRGARAPLATQTGRCSGAGRPRLAGFLFGPEAAGNINDSAWPRRRSIKSGHCQPIATQLGSSHWPGRRRQWVASHWRRMGADLPRHRAQSGARNILAPGGRKWPTRACRPSWRQGALQTRAIVDLREPAGQPCGLVDVSRARLGAGAPPAGPQSGPTRPGSGSAANLIGERWRARRGHVRAPGSSMSPFLNFV